MAQTLRDLSAFWVMFHVFCLFIMLFRSRYTKKKTLLLTGIGIGVLILLNAAGLLILGYEVMGRLFFITCSIPSFVFFYVMSADKKTRFLFTFCLADTSCLWIIGVTLLLDAYPGGGNGWVMLLSRLIALPLLEYCVYRYLRKPFLELQAVVEKGWGVFFGMTLLYYVLLIVVLYYPNNIENRPEDVFVCVLILILMLFNYATIFTALYRQLLLYRKQQSERLLQEQKLSLKAQLENQQRIRRMKHDMKTHTATLGGLLSAGRTKEALGYIKNVEDEMDALWGPFCPNPYINAVLGYYLQKLSEMDGELLLDIQVGDEALPYMELCRILSNGLENACDAVGEFPERENRQVSLRMKYSRDYLVIRIKNRCRDGLHVEKGTVPFTEKEGSDHGFGLPTVREAAEKLGGDMVCYTEKGFFVLDAMVRTRSC